jgi:NADPH2:quinone reductase
MGYAAGTHTDLRLTDLIWKRASLSGFSLFVATAKQQAEAYETILPLIAGGDIGPAHERTFTLDQAPEAMRHLIEDRPYGKVTLTIPGGDHRGQPSLPLPSR